MSQLSVQEKIFLDRMATYLAGKELNDAAIDEAARMVIADDRRLIKKLFGDEQFCDAAKKHLSPIVYDAIKARCT